MSSNSDALNKADSVTISVSAGQDDCKRVFATLADNVIITAGSHDQADVR